jgi:enoyl-CoA hydratase/carnithine racemase
VLTGAGPTFRAGFDLDEFGRAELAQQINDSSLSGISPSRWWPPSTDRDGWRNGFERAL